MSFPHSSLCPSPPLLSSHPLASSLSHIVTMGRCCPPPSFSSTPPHPPSLSYTHTVARRWRPSCWRWLRPHGAPLLQPQVATMSSELPDLDDRSSPRPSHGNSGDLLTAIAATSSSQRTVAVARPPIGGAPPPHGHPLLQPWRDHRELRASNAGHRKLGVGGRGASTSRRTAAAARPPVGTLLQPRPLMMN